MKKILAHLTDTELAQAFNQHHAAAFEEIYNRFWLKLFNHARRMVDDPDMARDVVQEVFTTLLERRGKLELQKSISTFLHVSVRNRVLDLISHQKVKNGFIERMMRYDLDTTWNTSEAIQAKELAALLDQEIQRLPARMKETLNLRREEQLSISEIADRTNTSPATVRKQMYSALKILRSKINILLLLVIC